MSQSKAKARRSGGTDSAMKVKRANGAAVRPVREEGQPLLALHTGPREERDDERELYLTIDDDEFWILKEVPPVTAVRLMRDLQTMGQLEATARAMGYLLGDEAMDRLSEVHTLTEDQLGLLMDDISDRVQGMAEKAGKGS